MMAVERISHTAPHTLVTIYRNVARIGHHLSNCLPAVIKSCHPPKEVTLRMEKGICRVQGALNPPMDHANHLPLPIVTQNPGPTTAYHRLRLGRS